MAASHRRVERPEIEEPFDKILVGDVDLFEGKLAGVPRRAVRLTNRERGGLLHFVVESFTDLAELLAEPFELLGKDRANGLRDDVGDDRIGGVVRTAGLAFGLVVREVDLTFAHTDLRRLPPLLLRIAERDERFLPLLGLGGEIFLGELEFELEQPFVD